MKKVIALGQFRLQEEQLTYLAGVLGEWDSIHTEFNRPGLLQEHGEANHFLIKWIKSTVNSCCKRPVFGRHEILV